MPAMPEQIAKAPFLRRIDFASRNRAAYDLNQLSKDLDPQAGNNLVDVGKNYGWIRAGAEELHFRNDWFNETGQGWWQQAQPIEPIIRTGLLKVVELFEQYDKPIDSWWQCLTPTTSGTVSVFTMVSDRQITVLFNTPAPPSGGAVAQVVFVQTPVVWITDRRGSRTAGSQVPDGGATAE